MPPIIVRYAITLLFTNASGTERVLRPPIAIALLVNFVIVAVDGVSVEKGRKREREKLCRDEVSQYFTVRLS